MKYVLTRRLTAPVWACLILSAPHLAVGQANDGKIAFYSGRNGRDDIFLMNADGTDVQLITKGEYGGKCPDISPDGTRIIFVSLRDDNSDLYLVDLASGEEQRLTDLPSAERQPKWAPDGKRIAFQSDRDGNYEIYVMDADGSNWQRLTFNDAEELWPSWSRDGQQIAFSSFRDGNWEIYVVGANGTGLRRVTHSGDGEMHPSWSPDGTRFAYQRRPPAVRFQNDIHVMNVDGTNDRKLTDFDGVEENPVWSPDGTQIAFQTMKDGNFEIYVMDADSSRLVNLTNHPANDYWPSWVVSGKSSTVAPRGGEKLPAKAVEFQILYDDVSHREDMEAGRGFSCLVKAGGKTLLMDAGGDSQLLLSNMAACKVDLADIDIVILSHCNSDHIGGLPSVLRSSGTVMKVYLPGGKLPGNLAGRALEIIPAKIDTIKSLVTSLVFVETPVQICDGIMSTGLLGDDIPEQGLVLLTEAGTIVITGCAHPGITQIVRRVFELTGEPILLTMGGFHLVAESQYTIDSLAEELDSMTTYIAPCHCSGDLARARFSLRFGTRYLELSAGSILRLADLVTNIEKEKDM